MLNYLKNIFYSNLLIICFLIPNIRSAENPNGMTLDSVELYGVSTMIGEISHKPYGSLMGGTYIYLSVSGHDLTPSNNKIMVGPYECKIPEKGVNENTITCETSPAIYPERRDNLPVEIFVTGKEQNQCKGSCNFSYREAQTPYLRVIEPNTANSGEFVKWYGIWRVENEADIKQMALYNEQYGKFNCNRFDIHNQNGPLNLNIDKELNKNANVFITCQVSEVQPGGIYTLQTKNTYGDSYLLPQVQHITIDGSKEYNFVLTPVITSINQNQGGDQGNQLIINGKGFGNRKENVSVNIENMNCNVIKVDNQQLICNLEPGETSTFDDSSQNQQFIGGQGVSYKEYNLDGLGIWSAQQFKDNFQTLADDLILNEDVIGNWAYTMDQKLTGVVMKGFIKAPRDGQYNFWVTGDDTVAVYINKTVPNNTEQANMEQILYKCGWTQYREYFYPNECDYRSDSITLQANNYYWVEVYAFNSQGTGSVSLAVETPEIQNYEMKNTVDKIQEIQIIADADYEEWVLTVNNYSDTFGVQFVYTDTKERKTYKDSTELKTWDSWDSNNLGNQINKASGYQGVTVSEEIIDNNSQKCSAYETPSDCIATGKIWTIKWSQYRIEGRRSVNPQIIDNSIPSENYILEQTKQQSDPVQGTYKLAYNGETIEVWDQQWTDIIPFSMDGNSIRVGLMYHTDNFQIQGYNYSINAETGRKYKIWFRSKKDKGNIEGLTVVENNLTGGKVGTTPQIQITDFLLGSNRPFHEPIPYDMSFTGSIQPNIQLQVNDIFANCKGNCSYIASQNLSPIIQSFTLNGRDLTIDISGNNHITSIDETNTLIKFGTQTCQNPIFTNLEAVACQLPLDPEAGNYKPIVQLIDYGFSNYESNVTDQVIGLTLNDLNPKIGSIQGGILITIDGTGFPISEEGKQSLEIKFGNSIVKVIQVISSTQIIVELPETSDDISSPVKVQLFLNNQQSDISDSTSEFQYTDAGLPSVTSIIPTSASPVLKSQIQIEGTNFSTDKSQLKVYLVSIQDSVEIVAYELNINSSTDTQITATLGGGTVGDYFVKVAKEGFGYSNKDIAFKYIIKVTSVSPQSGSFIGGTILTIQGENFSNNLFDNAVWLQYTPEIVNQCYVLDASSTEITCRTPLINQDIPDNEVLNVIVQGRLIEDSTCETPQNCQFTYLTQNESPTLNYEFLALKNLFTNSENLEIQGTQFNLGSGIQLEISSQINTDNTWKIDGIVNSEESATFTLPNDMEEGPYTIFVNIVNIGYAGVFAIDIEFSYENISISPTDEISKGGQEITINGSGFDQKSIQIYVNNQDKQCEITTINPSQIICILPQVTTQGLKSLKIEQFSQLNQENIILTCENCIYYSNNVTPLITETTPSFQSTIPADSQVTITIVQADLKGKDILSAYLQDQNKLDMKHNSSSVSNTELIFDNIPAGNYLLKVVVQDLGYVFIDQGTFIITFTVDNLSAITTSLVGGNKVSITGKGFHISENLELNKINICGFKCPIQDTTTFSQLDCIIPKIPSIYLKDQNNGSTSQILIDKQVISQHKSHKITDFVFIADNIDAAPLIADNQTRTFYTASENVEECYIGFDFGATKNIIVEQIKFKGKTGQGTEGAFKKLRGAVFQKSTDSTNWDDIYTVGNEIHSGFNTHKIDYDANNYARYYRFKNNNNEEKNCEFSEIIIKGYEYQAGGVSGSQEDILCDITVGINDQIESQQDKITLSASDTPVVSDINPIYGWQLGGDTVTITGTGFGTDVNQVEVLIDLIECIATDVTDTQITCTTGNKGANNTEPPSLSIMINNFKALVPDNLQFYYGLLWSMDDSWGGEAAPRQLDSVYIPKGQTLIIDQSSPIYLNAVICEGILIFADNIDITFDAVYIVVRKGKLIIGQEGKPYNNKLTITLHGNYYMDQLPEVGNKVLACLQCELNIYGQKKTPTWTVLKETIDIGGTTLKTKTTTNWVIGDILVIATTDFDGKHSEEVKIIEIVHDTDNDFDTITFEPALQYQHISVIESYNTYELKMEAEVGVLSRNVIIRGNPSDSIDEEYGGHLIVHGKTDAGSIAKISHAEFQYMGQPRIIGRYNIHFHMNGNAIDSFVDGVSAHDSFARLIAIHAVSYLKVSNSVAYNCKGHNIFLEDGIETHNIIEHNLIVSPKSADNMHQTDLTVACIWVTNPLNYVRYNSVVGSEFYGMWYEIKHHPDGPSATADICPEGMPIGDLSHNIGHSNTRFGLRFFHLYPREFPCEDLKEEGAIDPFQINPSIPTLISNFTSYKNGESGVLAEHVGNMVFENIIMADNYRAGFEAHDTSYTKEDVVLQNSLIVGRSTANSETIQFHSDAQTCAISYPRSSGFNVKNVEIHNFEEGSHIMESCSQNQFTKLQTVGGKQHNMELITLVGCENANMVKYLGPRQNVFFDSDGSFTSTNQPTFITPYYPHFDKQIADGNCQDKTQSDNKYDNSVVCSGITVRGVFIEGVESKRDFEEQLMKIFNLSDDTKYWGPDQLSEEDQYSQEQEEYFSQSKSGDMLAPDCFACYAAQLPVGGIYNFHWSIGLDFKRIIVDNSKYYSLEDPNTILRFNYTETRELFDIHQQYGWSTHDLIFQQSSLDSFIDPLTNLPNVNDDTKCGNGDYIIDYDNKLMYLCLSAKNKQDPLEKIRIEGIYCRDTCPTPGFSCEKEIGALRQFSNQEQYLEDNQGSKALRKPAGSGDEDWEYGVPQTGDDVLIPCEWTMVFDVDSFEFGTLIIDGTLKFDQSKSHQILKATNIWVRGGKLVAGSKDTPISGKIEIELVGNKNSLPLIIDDFSRTGTKSLAVTGLLELYGETVVNVQTRLKANAQSGQKVIQVIDDISDWQQGDIIVLGASQVNGQGFEQHVIDSINIDTKEITLIDNLQYFHYGDIKKTVGTNSDTFNVIINGNIGQTLDMRCAVGHISRNIKIFGSDEDSWGGHLQIYHWIQDEISARGRVILEGVELSNMGQMDTENAGLHIFYTNTDGDKSIINKSSIHDCQGKCMRADNGYNVDLTNNILYRGELSVLEVISGKKWNINNNLLIGAIGSTGGVSPFISLFLMHEMYDPQSDELVVENNVGQGSEGLGFGFPGTPCGQQENITFKNNEIGYSQVGIIFNNKIEPCLYEGHVSVYSCQEGISINTSESSYILDKVIVAECGKGIELRSGSGGVIIHNNFLKNAWISAVVLQEICPSCYEREDQTFCINSKAIQLHVTVQHGNTLVTTPFQGLDAICNQPPPFTSMFLENVEFVNYKSTYTNSICQNNIIFRNHPVASDATAGHYLTNVQCTDCEQTQFAKLDDPNTEWRGWFGGCGDMDCTGLENVLIQDMTGDLLGFIGSIISSNEHIGDSLDECQYITQWNGYQCETPNLGILEWDAIGPDKLMMVTSPVSLKNDKFENIINIYREWGWNGPEPLNQRPNSYNAIIEINQVHNVTYAGTKPFDLMHKLQQRTVLGEENRFIILQYQYSSPMTIQVLIDGNLIDPFPFSQPVDLLEHTTECGAHNYFHENRTIHFVINNVPTCQVQVRLVNNVQVNIRLSMSSEEFFSDDSAQTNFIDRISSFLSIPTNRLKIVGIKDVSRLRILQQGDSQIDIQFQITGEPAGTADTGYSPQTSFIELQNLAKNLETNIQQIDLGAQVLEIGYNVIVAQSAGSEDSSDFFTEEDLVENNGSNNGGNEGDNQDNQNNQNNNSDSVNENNIGKGTNKEKQENSVSIGVIIFASICGVIAVGIIITIIHIVYKAKFGKKQQLTEQQKGVIQKARASIKKLSMKMGNVNSQNNQEYINQLNVEYQNSPLQSVDKQDASPTTKRIQKFQFQYTTDFKEDPILNEDQGMVNYKKTNKKRKNKFKFDTGKESQFSLQEQQQNIENKNDNSSDSKTNSDEQQEDGQNLNTFSDINSVSQNTLKQQKSQKPQQRVNNLIEPEIEIVNIKNNSKN